MTANLFDFMRRAGLMVIQFQFVLCHPDLYVRDAGLHSQDSDEAVSDQN